MFLLSLHNCSAMTGSITDAVLMCCKDAGPCASEVELCDSGSMRVKVMTWACAFLWSTSLHDMSLETISQGATRPAEAILQVPLSSSASTSHHNENSTDMGHHPDDKSTWMIAHRLPLQGILSSTRALV